MLRTLTLLHSSTESVVEWDSLLAERSPTLPVRHVALTHLEGMTGGQVQAETAKAAAEETELGAAAIVCVCPRIAEAAAALGLQFFTAEPDDLRRAVKTASKAANL